MRLLLTLLISGDDMKQYLIDRFKSLMHTKEDIVDRNNIALSNFFKFSEEVGRGALTTAVNAYIDETLEEYDKRTLITSVLTATYTPSWPLRVGDIVVARNVRNQKISTLGVVVGKMKIICYESRWTSNQGEYAKDGLAAVLWENGIFDYVDACDMTLLDQRKDRSREYRDADLSYSDWTSNKTRIGDLPDSEFWEGDYVVEVGKDPNDLLMITGMIYWENFAEYEAALVNNKTREKILDVPVDSENLKLKERGHLWNLAHCRKPMFVSLQDEFQFALMTGRTHQITPDKGYHWEDVVDLIHLGKADVAYKDRIRFDWEYTPFGYKLYKCDDVGLGNRLREAFKQYRR